MIPEPLSAAAAEMVATHDALLREREEFVRMRMRVYTRSQRLLYAQIASIAACVTIGITALAWR